MLSFNAVLGILTATLIGLSLTRKLAKLLLPTLAKGRKESSSTPTLWVKSLIFLNRFHKYFAIGAFLSALTHASIILVSSGFTRTSLSGGTLVILLATQGVTGYLQEKRKGNLKLFSRIHSVLPFVVVAVVIAHIFLNDYGF